MDINNKYHNGKIYKIIDIGYNKCYIGSTTEELSQRMARHRAHYKRFLNGKYRHTSSYDIFNEYGVENCKIELIEYYKCDTLAELLRKEGEHIKNNECVNKVVAGRTKQEYMKEYREQNKDTIKEYDREYRDKHKEQLREKRLERYKLKQELQTNKKIG